MCPPEKTDAVGGTPVEDLPGANPVVGAESGTANIVVRISGEDGDLNLALAADAGVRGVIHRATWGVSGLDSSLEINLAKAKRAGLWIGAYHRGIGASGIAQAKHFLRSLAPWPEILPALEIAPDPPGQRLTAHEAVEFVTHVREMTGRWPGLHGRPGLVDQLEAPNNAILSHCWLSLDDDREVPKAPAPWTSWTFWQYTDGVRGGEPRGVAGIGPCQRLRFNGDEPALARLWGNAEAIPLP